MKMKTIKQIEKESIQNQIIAEIKEHWMNIGDISDWYHTFWKLYKHRITLFIIVINLLTKEDERVWQSDTVPVLYKCYKSKQHWDWNKMYKWWFIAWVNTEEWEQISYHLPMEYWDKLNCPEVWHSPKWDWHTSDDVLERLLNI